MDDATLSPDTAKVRELRRMLALARDAAGDPDAPVTARHLGQFIVGLLAHAPKAAAFLIRDSDAFAMIRSMAQAAMHFDPVTGGEVHALLTDMGIGYLLGPSDGAPDAVPLTAQDLENQSAFVAGMRAGSSVGAAFAAEQNAEPQPVNLGEVLVTALREQGIQCDDKQIAPVIDRLMEAMGFEKYEPEQAPDN